MKNKKRKIKKLITFWRDSEKFWLERYVQTGDKGYLRNSLTSYNQVLVQLLRD